MAAAAFLSHAACTAEPPQKSKKTFFTDTWFSARSNGNHAAVEWLRLFDHDRVGGFLCGALPGAGDMLPPQRGEVAFLAGRREGFRLGASS